MDSKNLKLLMELDINDDEIVIENIIVNGKRKKVRGIKKLTSPVLNGEWRFIPGYSEYMANANGEIYSTKTDTILKCFYSEQNGSYRVSLNGDLMDVKDIIGALFVPNPKNYWKVWNINGDQTDNRASNLVFIPWKKPSKENQINKARMEEFLGKKLRG